MMSLSNFNNKNSNFYEEKYNPILYITKIISSYMKCYIILIYNIYIIIYYIKVFTKKNLIKNKK